MAVQAPQRLALVVHPSRPIEGALERLRAWSDERGIDVVQLEAGTHYRQVATLGEAGPCDLVVAVGGDGTVLAALRASAPTETPVLGVACGSLGALTTVSADDLGDALDRFAAGDWVPRVLPALVIESDAGEQVWSINDVAFTRAPSGQLVADVSVDGELYVRMAGDGVIVATALGSSAYSMAAGGPLLAGACPAFVCTPIAMHGGSAPPVVVDADATLTVQVHPGFAGFFVELDGQPADVAGERFEIRVHRDKVRLVAFGRTDDGMFAGLRKRLLVTDSPRVLARDERERRAHGSAPATDGTIR